MNLKARRFLYYFFILLFVIITPIISLYATGYKIGSGFHIQKTGILIINSEPKNAKIYLDGKVQKKLINRILGKKEYITTPAKIKGLLPGEYNIKLELDNYWEWNKKLSINPSESTFAENINLFRKDLPVMISDGDYINSSLYLNKKDILVAKDNEITIINRDNEEVKKINFEEPISNINWSNDKEKIIINQKILNLDSNETQSLEKILEVNIEKISWGKNSNEIYYQNNDTINRYNFNTLIKEKILTQKNIDNFFVKNNYLFLTDRNNDKSELKIWDMEKGELLRIVSLPLSNYDFINKNHKLINLYDKKYQILYLIDSFSPFRPIKEIISDVKKTYWQDDEVLFFANDFEIWMLNLKNNQKILLTRISRKIEKIISHPSKNYLIFATEKDINILELDNREKYNITKIFDLTQTADLQMSEKGDILYFNTKIGNQEGIYKLLIK